MGFFINLWTALPSIMTRGGGLQHRAVTAYLLAFLFLSLGMVAGCGSSSSLFKCFPSSTQTWSPPSANIYAQTEDLGGQDTGNVHTDDPAQVDQTTAADCARQLLAKLPSGITTVQAALDNMYVNDEIAVADEFVKQLPGSLLQSLVQTRPGRLLVFHVFLDVTGEDSGVGPEPTGPAGDSATAQKLNRMLLASFPDFQRLYNQPWLGDPIVQAAASQHGTSFQTLAGGNGPYRFDDFTIIIQHMPLGLTPQAFLGEMAQDMNKAANDQQFNDLSTFKWRDTSHPPMIGDINDINFGSAWGLPAPGVPSPVMLVEKADTHFVFQTLQGHILHGSREFGFYALPDGHVLLYTRAISRDSSILSHFGGVAGHANELQVRTWTNFMIGVCNEMQRRGGSCNPQKPDEGEQPWTRRLNLSVASVQATPTHTAGPSGTITEYPIPTSDSFPYGITAGPDGNLWFTEQKGNQIGKITPGGTITEYPIPTSNSFPRGITAGPDGNLWFTELSGNQIGKITPGGTITEYPIPTSNSYPYAITAGPDGNLWFTEQRGNQIGKITP